MQPVDGTVLSSAGHVPFTRKKRERKKKNKFKTIIIIMKTSRRGRRRRTEGNGGNSIFRFNINILRHETKLEGSRDKHRPTEIRRITTAGVCVWGGVEEERGP